MSYRRLDSDGEVGSMQISGELYGTQEVSMLGQGMSDGSAMIFESRAEDEEIEAVDIDLMATSP
jgi:hypothetical protein